ncbi:hypothetical protein M3Y98_00193300 [Aphelenchoides besseyi]|nr:hypothetical protein M3Y98_00193300 [Aphelenchoides besseyi]KAI6200233.1 hypothetical protein M3Y96_00711200 [Aphelenchoides besseyi]
MAFSWTSTLFFFILLAVVCEAKIYNLLHCDVRGNFIHECDGTLTPITPKHEQILSEYMKQLASYYRGLYAINPNTHGDTPVILREPIYPQLCKVCDDNSL